MRICEKLYIIIIVLIASSFICNVVFSNERKNPFADCFPRKKIDITGQVENLTIEYEEEVFDTSLYNVEGLIWGAYKPKAIINNKIYGLGDKLGEAEIVKIDKEGTTVLFNEKEYVVVPRQKITLSLINSTKSDNSEGVDDEF